MKSVCVCVCFSWCVDVKVYEFCFFSMSAWFFLGVYKLIYLLNLQVNPLHPSAGNTAAYTYSQIHLHHLKRGGCFEETIYL